MSSHTVDIPLPNTNILNSKFFLLHEKCEHVKHIHIIHFHQLYTNEILVLFNYYLDQLNLENIQQQYPQLIISRFHPIAYFVFLYQFFCWFFCMIFSLTWKYFLINCLRQNHFALFLYFIKPRITARARWNDSFSIVVFSNERHQWLPPEEQNILHHIFPSSLFVLYYISELTRVHIFQ